MIQIIEKAQEEVRRMIREKLEELEVLKKKIRGE